MAATTLTAHRPLHRLAFGALTLLLTAAVVLAALDRGADWWQLAGFGLGPDLALLLGISSTATRGQLHPRAVPLYNAVHRFWGPLALGTAALLGLLPGAFVVGALAWALHVSLDRTVGYGLRTRDGFQRA